MKKFFLFAAALIVAVSSCTNNAMDEPQINNEITFQVANFAAQTKANTQYPINYSFGAYAWFYDGSMASYDIDPTKAQPFMSNEKVSRDPDVPNYWKPASTYYWPKSGHIDFISVSPWKATSLFTVTQDNIKVTNYSINQDDDLMYADKAVDQTQNLNTYYSTGVPTLFHHALAKINFKVKQKEASSNGTEWTIAVKKIMVTGLSATGSVELPLATDGETWTLPTVPEPGESIPTAHVWDANYTDIPALASKAWENNTDVTVGGKTIHGMQISTTAAYYTTGTAEAKNFFVIPMFLKNVKFTVVYDIITKLPNGSYTSETNKTDEVIAKTTSLYAWEMNKNITYTFTISGSTLNPIYFDPAVADWDDVSGTEIEL